MTPSPTVAYDDAQAPTFGVSRWVFLRLLGCVYLAAFWSAAVQIEGLVGNGGILPVADHLERAYQLLGDEAYYRLPTLCWLSPDKPYLTELCIAGAALSGVLIFGIMPGPVLALLWALYLSLTVAGQDFFGYQWDGLLLETGLLAVFYAPWSVWPRAQLEAPPSPIMRWLYSWLLFRLMFASGVAKLLSGDQSWLHLDALTFHYETQPLPTWTSWYAHQLPVWFHMACTAATLAVELVLPVMLFGPRRLRHLACGGLAAFQLVLAATGNFGFFNLLALALCIPPVADEVFPAWLRRPLHRDRFAAPEALPARDCLLLPVAFVLVVLSLVPFLVNAGLARAWPAWLTRGYEVAASFHSVNSYGLFTVMTTTRRELVIEGSDDGQTWRAYEFRYKPGDPARRPEFTGPHLPRLDWQMWFAALGRHEESVWFRNLLRRLQDGAPEVLGLLADNPFPDGPPRLLRVTVYQYHFTDAATREATGAWWSRTKAGN